MPLTQAVEGYSLFDSKKVQKGRIAAQGPHQYVALIDTFQSYSKSLKTRRLERCVLACK